GTLDPLASGLLLVCVGRATKTIPQLQDGDKVYTGTIAFGATTPCYDLERRIDSYYPFKHITRELVEREAAAMCGTIEQVPPVFSAVKVNGQRAYKCARENAAEVEVKAKTVVIYSFDITAFSPATTTFEVLPSIAQPDGEAPQRGLYKDPQGVVPDGLPTAAFRIACGKGTYVRSMVRDLGLALDSGAVLTSLRRERVGDYSLQQAVGPDNLDDFGGF
ncbi:MAG: hypothetical protein K5650_07535, partial [Bacteroidales bacterium]|nr:hypothetical protein [Bacteroidales bacterium]